LRLTPAERLAASVQSVPPGRWCAVSVDDLRDALAELAEREAKLQRILRAYEAWAAGEGGGNAAMAEIGSALLAGGTT
jgi:hypothetical protein